MSAITLDPRVLAPRLGVPALLDAARRSTPSGRLVAAYVFFMPLIAGIPRGSVVPVLRLTEVLQLGLTGLGVVFAVLAYTRGGRWRFVIQPVDWWMLAVAVCGSIVPVVSLMARGESVGIDELLSAFPMTKYLMLWLLVRMAARTIADVTVVLVAAVSTGLIVAGLAVLEGLGIGPTGRFTRSLVTSDTVTGAVEGRAYTLLGSGLSTGAVLAICATVAFGFAVTHRSPAAIGATGVILFGALATGQATSALALVFIIALVAIHHRVVGRTIAVGVPALVIALAFMAPVIQGRLDDAGSRSIVPQSWQIRWVNVTELYWPQIADGGWLLGVTPDTIVIPPDTWREEVFLESGYLWMLWVGGLPLLFAFVGLLAACWRRLDFETNDPTYEVVRVTARGVIGFMAVFNIIDPHLSLRGGADLMYVLVPLAFAFTPLSQPATRRSDALNLVETRDHRAISAHARIQIGEIGGPLLRASGWPSVSPGHGYDRGLDIAVRDRGVTIGEARVYFEGEGNHLDGLMLHPVRSVDDAAEALVWRGIMLCAQSMRLRSLMTPPGANGLAELDRREIAEIAARAERLEAQRYDDQELTNLLNRGAPWSEHDAATPVGIRLEPYRGVSLVRRAIDVAVAGGALLVLAPFAVPIALLIRRSSPGPVFFRQMRIGAGGRPFRLVKFRTMDNRAGPDLHRASIEQSVQTGIRSTKIADDPRVTRVGAFLRTWSLDEFPQLLNVVRGEMTLVGPRPSLVWETSTFSPQMRRRLQLRPGIAGLWQASGRGDLSNEEMLELDLDYAESASLANDAKLLVQTAVAVITRKGAR